MKKKNLNTNNANYHQYWKECERHTNRIFWTRIRNISVTVSVCYFGHKQKKNLKKEIWEFYHFYQRLNIEEGIEELLLEITLFSSSRKGERGFPEKCCFGEFGRERERETLLDGRERGFKKWNRWRFCLFYTNRWRTLEEHFGRFLYFKDYTTLCSFFSLF